MDKKILEEHIEQGMSTRQIAKEENCSQYRIRYWLKKYSIVTNYANRASYKNCTLCTKDTVKGRRFCPGCQTKIRRYRTKKAAVALLGNKCKRCEWKGPLAAFSFHHLKDKEFEIASVANKSWKVIKEEIKKCELLCTNCHGIEHSNVYPEFLEAVENYKGTLLEW